VECELFWMHFELIKYGCDVTKVVRFQSCSYDISSIMCTYLRHICDNQLNECIWSSKFLSCINTDLEHKHLQWIIFKWLDDYKKVWQYVGWQKTYQGIKVCLTCVSGGNSKGQCAMKDRIKWRTRIWWRLIVWGG